MPGGHLDPGAVGQATVDPAYSSVIVSNESGDRDAHLDSRACRTSVIDEKLVEHEPPRCDEQVDACTILDAPHPLVVVEGERDFPNRGCPRAEDVLE